MSRRLAALGAVALLALTGCAGGPEAAPVATNASSTPPLSPTQAQADPMVYQAWAKRERAAITKWVRSWDGSDCSAISFALDGDDPLCSAKLLSGTYVARTLEFTALGAKGALTPTSASYIGDPPAGQAVTVDEVAEAIKEAAKQSARWSTLDCTATVENDGCVNVALMLPDAMDKLDTALSSLE